MTKLSRSKIELFRDCPHCFWLEMRHKIKRPPPMPYTINNAIDYLLKQEFDTYRELGKPHPIMTQAKIAGVPHQNPKLNSWRHNFTGIQFHHEPTDFLVYGAVDDIWENEKGELMVVDYKATGALQHKVYDSYQRQIEVYQWLLRQNGFKVSPTAYFVFARVNKGGGFGMGTATLPFDIFVEPVTGDSSWVEGALGEAKKVFDGEAPTCAAECVYCTYRDCAKSV